MPPARQPDEVRKYWRAVVAARMSRGDLVGDVQKPKKLTKPGTGVEQVNGSGGRHDEDLPDGEVLDTDEDDFFE